MIKPLFLYLSLILCLTACRKTGPVSADRKAITEKVNRLYHQYGSSNEAVYNQPISDDLFSPELKKLLETSINTSKADIEKVKNSDYPDEKPLLFEGAIFSSLYEGYSSYSIQSIDIKDNTADVVINLEHSDAGIHSEKDNPTTSSKILWKDSIHLINTDNRGWRIDNISFDKKMAGSKDLKTSLTNFTQIIQQ
ncbi:hypothetical protein P2W68_05510 [Chryseobacterium arthrosphaerae]|uniref:hypothetical protein n=1 Tax=Chryseobacterium arthrosphaerae TaxID=651561 RepID=UPI0023E14A52|nr:hypothetical protein [Chryseobacterium arthrosphaerae]WES99071.1 hypothetical protein P2W68_05510 [Chryseobacterium arthrosphaerae]